MQYFHRIPKHNKCGKIKFRLCRKSNPSIRWGGQVHPSPPRGAATAVREGQYHSRCYIPESVAQMERVELNPIIFQRMIRQLSLIPSIDLFGSRLRHQLPIYVS